MQKVWQELVNELQYINEISQADNLNATTRIWIQSNGLLYKQYVIWNLTTFRNILSLLVAGCNSSLRSNPQIVTPERIVFFGLIPKGYVMDYCRGQTMRDFLDNPKFSPTAKLSCFQNLADAINHIPRNIFIGDLHGGNVIVSEDSSIRIIDVDGFSFSGNEISCPMSYVPDADESFPARKYWHRSGKFRISRNSDILCFFSMFLQWLMGDLYPFGYTTEELLRYISYLETAGFPSQIVQMMRRLFDEAPNEINPEPFGQIDISQLSNYTYSAYRAWEAQSFR